MTLADDGGKPAGKKPYKVGYCKTPEATRFKPGQSGNPKGRGKGIRNVRTVLLEAMNMPMTVSVGGKRKKKTAMEIAFTRMMHGAAEGNWKAGDQFRAYVFALKLLEQDTDDTRARLTDEELDLVRRKFGDDFLGGGEEDGQESGEEGQGEEGEE